MKLSEQHVHSRPWSQSTGTRGFSSKARAIRGANMGGKPRDAVVSEMNFRKLRRLIPCRRITS
jgi:hypothetical protein